MNKLIGSIYESDHASPGLLFWRAFYNWQGLVQSQLAKFDITQVQYSILAALSYLGSTLSEVTQQNISQQLSMDKMMVSSVVKTLIEKKLILRSPHTSDARSYALSLTKAGRAKIEQCVPIVESTDERFFRSVGDDKSYVKLVQSLKVLALTRRVDGPSK